MSVRTRTNIGRKRAYDVSMVGVTLPLTVLEAEAVVLTAEALLFAAVWWRAREPGMPALAVGFAFAAIWYFNADALRYTGPFIDTAQLRVWSIVLGLSVLVVTLGIVQYLGMPSGALRMLLIAGWAPSLLLAIALAVGVAVPHTVFRAGALVAYIAPALLAFRRAVQQPGDGHAALGLTLLTFPALPFLLASMGVEGVQLRYFAGLSVTVFGIIVLAISLLRRHRALEAEVQRRSAAEAQLRVANTELEERVSQRTAHLHELIDGLETFSRGVSHDLRGPLGGMSQLANMAVDALRRGDATLAHRALPTIASQCDASMRMVGSMLDLARLGEAKVRREPVVLAELARAAYDEVLLSAAGVQAVLHVAVMPPVKADPDLLRTTFVNLMANAVKFTRTVAAPRINVEATVVGRDVTICVSDNGIGFAPAAAAQLFEPFYRGHDVAYEGHGLGLSIVRRAVQAMGGTVSAHAVEDGGARVCFTIPGALMVAEAGGVALTGAT